MAEGLVDFLEFAIAVVFAAPVGLLGVIMATDGQVGVGVALLAVAVGMVALDRYVLAPRDIVAGFLRGIFGGVAGSDDPEKK